MKKIVLASLMMVCLPLWAMAQSAGDDLYFIPKKKTEKKEEVKKQETKTVTTVQTGTTTVQTVSAPPVVIKDVKGRVRDVDEYNRRYTSRENRFSMENDTLYIEEKPLNERGEWVNGFEGSQDDYEYAMRIIRFRNPRYAIPVSSPLYWDVVYGAYPSWDWNVYDDGMYAYIFPTYTNRLWWDWRWNYPYGSSWTYWGWHSPWYYDSWYGLGWWGGYWGGYWAWNHHHHYHHYAWGGGHWGGGHGGWSRPAWYDTRRGESRLGRNYLSNRGSNRITGSGFSAGRVGDRRINRVSATGTDRVAGRVVRGDRTTGASASVRPNRVSSRTENISSGVNNAYRSDRTRPAGTYTRPSTANRSGSTYTRPSSTRSSVNRESTGTYQRTNAAGRSSGYSRRGSSTRQTNTYNRSNNNYNNSSRSSSYSSGSISRSSYSSGGGSSSSRSSGGGGGGSARRR